MSAAAMDRVHTGRVPVPPAGVEGRRSWAATRRRSGAVVAMLACARIGAVHSVVFGGFAANELALRIDDAAPAVVVSASCGIEVNRVVAYKPILDKAIELANHTPAHCVLLQRPQAVAELTPGRDLD